MQLERLQKAALIVNGLYDRAEELSVDEDEECFSLEGVSAIEIYPSLSEIYGDRGHISVAPRINYEDAVAEIQDAPDDGMWPSLKEALIVTEAVLESKKDAKRCFLNRQKNLLIRQLVAVKEKMADATV